MFNNAGKEKNLYSTDDYIKKNPSIHEEDSPWKISKVIPMIDRFADYIKNDEINLLDVGGGAGLILKGASSYIQQSYNIKVNKIALDLSPGMLNIQKSNNPDIKKILNEDIQKTSLDHKEIDLTLMIDLLEHVPNPIQALKETKRISKFVIFKVPLEDNLYMKTRNFVTRGEHRQYGFEIVGHINIYNFKKIKSQIEEYLGEILYYYFTNVFDYYNNSKHYKNKTRKINSSINSFASQFFKLSPELCSYIFNDFAMILVKCY